MVLLDKSLNKGSFIMQNEFRFIDLFAGIGGFHLAMHSIGGKCVFASEIDKFARLTYTHNFYNICPELFDHGLFNEDIRTVVPNNIPDFDLLCAGFPCQPFSNAGLKKGFEDTRGTLFFNIAAIVNTKMMSGRPPKALCLENVKGLKGHDQGKTLKEIIRILNELNYHVRYQVLNSKYFGIPQNRERLFIIAWQADETSSDNFVFPLGLDENNNHIYHESLLDERSKKTRVGNILIPKDGLEEKYTISDRLYDGHLRRRKEHRLRGNGFGFSLFRAESPYTSTISARYYKDGSEILIEQEGKNPRKLHPAEAGKLQGFPVGNGFDIVVSDVQAYKQFGNSVSIPVVCALAKEIYNQIIQKEYVWIGQH